MKKLLWLDTCRTWGILLASLLKTKTCNYVFFQFSYAGWQHLLHPGKLTWQWNNPPFEDVSPIKNQVIFQCHVSFKGVLSTKIEGKVWLSSKKASEDDANASKCVIAILDTNTSWRKLSNVQNPYDIPWNPGWLIGILIMAYYNPYITGSYFIPFIQQIAGVLVTQLDLFFTYQPGWPNPRSPSSHEVCLGVNPKIGGFYPPNHPFVHRVFHYKPSILGYHYLWKHPFGYIY